MSQRYGDDIVRTILEQEAQQGDTAIAATDAVLSALQSSIADEFPLFAAWNSATGARAATGGYVNAADYPEVSVSELASEGAKAITSGLASFYYHARVTTPTRLTLDTDNARNRGQLVPFADGLPRLDHLTPLPADLNGRRHRGRERRHDSKKDAPFMLSLSAPSAAQANSTEDASGCSLGRAARTTRLPEPFALFVALFVATCFRANRARRVRRASSLMRQEPRIHPTRHRADPRRGSK